MPKSEQSITKCEVSNFIFSTILVIILVIIAVMVTQLKDDVEDKIENEEKAVTGFKDFFAALFGFNSTNTTRPRLTVTHGSDQLPYTNWPYKKFA